MTFTCQHCGVWNLVVTGAAEAPPRHDPHSPTQWLKCRQAFYRRCIVHLFSAFVHALYCHKIAHHRQCITQLCVAFVLALYCLKIAHCRLLQALLKHCPGMAQAHLLLAESHHLGGNSPVALRKVADVLHQAPDNISAHMLLTRIYLHQVSVFGHHMWGLLRRACYQFA